MWRNKGKSILILGLSVSLFITTCLGGWGAGFFSEKKVQAKDYGIANPRVTTNADGKVTKVTWDKVKFGSYYQTVDFEAEPIKWRILSVNKENDDLFLLADQNLDCKPYHETNSEVTWESCTLRSWLNGYDASENSNRKDYTSNNFIDSAFDSSEQSAIKQTTVVNAGDSYYETEGGNNTSDKVYLLSVSEASNAAYGFDEESRMDSKTRKAKNTAYAEFRGAYTYTYSDDSGNGSWWLRSPGDSGNAVRISSDGYCNIYGGEVCESDNAVRPVLHVSLSSAAFTSAGTVDSDGKYTSENSGYQNPRVVKNADGEIIKATWDCVYFGKYKQHISDTKTPIEWRVLSVNGDDAFLLADQSLDKKEYNETEKDVTWDKCTLRSWLNGDGAFSNEAGKDFSEDNFLDTAFTEKEKDAIKEQTIETKDDASYQTLGGDKTQDKIYLLSIADVTNVKYGFDKIFTQDSVTRQAKNSAYAIMQGANNYGDGSWWKLRSAYAGIRYEGHGYAGPQANAMPRVYGFVMNDFDAVRPALHLSLSSSVWEKADAVTVIGSGENDSTSADNKKTKIICKKITPEKKQYTIKKKGKTAKIVFNLTTSPENSLTNEAVEITVKNSKVLKVTKKKLTKKKLIITVKAKKKGKTTLTAKVGSKTSKVTITVKK